MEKEIETIKKNLNEVRELFEKVVRIIPEFNITDPKILPYGLKPHTRSVSWIVEQVITQQTKYNAKQLDLKEVDIDLPDTALHDCIIRTTTKRFYVNIKITNISGKANKNDISAVEKLYVQYMANPDYQLIFAVLGFRFQNTKISLSSDYIHTFSPQFLPIYINPRNDKIQAYYKAEPQYRTRGSFLQALKEKSTSIIL